MFKRIVNTSNDFALTIVRLVMGCVFFAHGAQKMLGWFGGYGFSGTMGFFTHQMGIPAPFAFLAICAEFFGGLGLIVGFLGAHRCLRNYLQHARGRHHGACEKWFLHELGGQSKRRRIRISPAGHRGRAADYRQGIGRSVRRPIPKRKTPLENRTARAYKSAGRFFIVP